MIKRVVLGFAVVCGAFAFILPMPAGAAPSVVAGPCQGTGAFQAGKFTKTAAETGVVEIPRKDTVAWEGSITGVTGESAYAGAIELETPAGLPTISIDSWKGTSDATSNKGEKKYDIPSWVPANVEFKVKGSHTQGGITCAGYVKLKIKGSALGPFSIGSLIGTVLTGLGLAVAGKAK
jgi:hypothetical protein